jgi:hypothetical protein
VLDARKREPSIAELLKTSEMVIKRADALEEKLHNPTAEVVYDILAMRGGARLYSRLVPLQMWAMEGDGPPTTGMTQVAEEQERELTQLERETRTFRRQDVAGVSAVATKLGLAYLIVPSLSVTASGF